LIAGLLAARVPLSTRYLQASHVIKGQDLACMALIGARSERHHVPVSERASEREPRFPAERASCERAVGELAEGLGGALGDVADLAATGEIDDTTRERECADLLGRRQVHDAGETVGEGDAPSPSPTSRTCIGVRVALVGL